MSVTSNGSILPMESVSKDLLSKGIGQFGTILADPPWQFINRTGKVAPEHRRLSRYSTMTLEEIKELPVQQIAAGKSHLYLWVPNALILEGLEVMHNWGFSYKTNLIWYKVRKDGGPDGRGVGFYFRNVTELILFGVRGSLRTSGAGRRQTNIVVSRKREHSRKPDELYDLIECCSPGPFLELFARHKRDNWCQWGNEIEMTDLQIGQPEINHLTSLTNGSASSSAVNNPPSGEERSLDPINRPNNPDQSTGGQKHRT